MRSLYLTLTVLAVLLVGAPATPQPPPVDASSAVFTVFSRGTPVGSFQTSVADTADGWTITSFGRLGSPMGIILRRATIHYDQQWHPLALTIDATTRGEPTSVETTFANGTAHEQITTKGTPVSTTETVAADAVLLPNPFFGAYEALAARVANAPAGTVLSIYAAPHVQYQARIGPSSSETLQTADGIVTGRQTSVTFLPTGQPPVDASLLIDRSGRLLRLIIPSQGLQVVRDDIAAVSTRRVTISRPNDQSVHVPDNGFDLAGTLSFPATATGATAAARLPAIVLVGPASQIDRDGVSGGVPVMGELAGELADAGFLVLRYDNRGTGQSGGRPDAATLDDYADDARAAVAFVHDRRDVDDDRIALLGNGDGGFIAMIAASKEKKIKALVLVDASSTTGAVLTLARQRQALAASPLSTADKDKRIALQKQVQQAVLTGKGWEGVPVAVRQQSDTPLFKSFLEFNPAEVMRDIRQPILIVQAGQGQETAPADGQQLETLAKARKNGAATLLPIAGVGPRLVAKDGTQVAPNVGPQIATWLLKAFSR